MLMQLILVCAACAPTGPVIPDEPLVPPSGATIPLTDLGSGLYLDQFQGGLYENGLNVVPSDHAARALDATGAIQPIDDKVVLVSAGMSNTTQEFCCKVTQNGTNLDGGVNPWSFMGQSAEEPLHPSLVIANCAMAQRTAVAWDQVSDGAYRFCRDGVLANLGLAELQIQAAWVKLVLVGNPIEAGIPSLPHPDAEAYQLEAALGRVVRSMKANWPNLRIVYLSSRIYAGYDRVSPSPEPFAYEGGFAVKWLIEAQIEQYRNNTIDPEAGDLGPGVAPILLWGPYLWADGINPRRDGLMWERADFEADGTHPSQSGERKVGAMLLEYFKTSPFAACWFIIDGACG